METIRTNATVKVMISYNYNHFEASMSLENQEGLSLREIDDARKDCQRLCDNAVHQYQKMKEVETKRINQRYEKEQLEREVHEIKQKSGELWTVTEKAKVKALADHDWNLRFDYYGDDDSMF